MAEFVNISHERQEVRVAYYLLVFLEYNSKMLRVVRLDFLRSEECGVPPHCH